MENMVDERFECLSVIFRLAGYSEYNDLELDSQKDIAKKFAKFILGLLQWIKFIRKKMFVSLV